MALAFVSELMILVFGNLYPAYASCRALIAKDPEELVHWMKYWVVFAAFTASSICSDQMISWFPGYYVIKILTLGWILTGNGNRFIYAEMLLPLYVHNEGKIEDCVTRMKAECYQKISEMCAKGLEFTKNAVVKVVLGAYNYVRSLEHPERIEQQVSNCVQIKNNLHKENNLRAEISDSEDNEAIAGGVEGAGFRETYADPDEPATTRFYDGVYFSQVAKVYGKVAEEVKVEDSDDDQDLQLKCCDSSENHNLMQKFLLDDLACDAVHKSESKLKGHRRHTSKQSKELCSPMVS